MGSIRSFNPVKLFIGVLTSEPNLLPAIKARLATLYGTIDHESPVIAFDFTDYYADEMGDVIDRIFFSFERLVEAEALAHRIGERMARPVFVHVRPGHFAFRVEIVELGRRDQRKMR